MRKLFMIALFSPIATFSQQQRLLPSVQTVAGSIKMPVLMHIDATLIYNQLMVMETFEEIANGKHYPSYLKLHVISNKPWVITARLANPDFIATTAGGKEMAANIIYLKKAGSEQYIQLSDVAQPFIYSTNNNVENDYIIDLKLASSFNYYGNQYNFNLVFSIQPR